MPKSKKTSKKAIVPQTPEPEEPKRLEDYYQSRPEQLTMFELLLPEDRRFSNTIELYDFIPKYVWGKVERINGEFLRALDRQFECRGRRYNVTIDPAKIKDKDGITRDYYPSKREELVEDALRKFAGEGQGVFLDDQAGVTFTLNQLQQELKRNGHSFSKDQIKDALMICAKAHLTVTTEENSTVLVSSLFETLGLQTREAWEEQGQKTRAFVRFNPLVTASIKSRSFRLFNYETSMAYSNTIARQLHKRMAHHYTQASLMNPYTISLSTIIRDFGLTVYKKLPDNLRDVLKALDEMKENNVIIDYAVEKVVDAKQRKKLIDAKIRLTPHPHFSSEVIHANKKQKTFPSISA
jgi:hypothetical protein